MISHSIENKIIIAKMKPGVKTLNVVAAPQVKNYLSTLIQEHDNVLFDLEGVNFIDSSGFGSLIAAFNLAKDNGHNFSICNINEKTMQLVKVTKLDSVFNIYPNKTDFFNSIKK